MNILVLQLKRIGDLVLTTPALAALRAAHPDANVTLAAGEGCRDLLPAIPYVDEAFAVSRRSPRGWRQVFTTRFQACLDFTGTDRSAFLTGISGASRRTTFQWVKGKGIRSMAYNHFVDCPVREHHTVDHYLQLAQSAGDRPRSDARHTASPSLVIPPEAAASVSALLSHSGIGPRYAVIHPGSARPEKYWAADRWAALIRHLQGCHGLSCIVTGGNDSFEREHIAQMLNLVPGSASHSTLDLSGRLNLAELTATIAGAALVTSCDTAAVHIAAAFERPQVALFGPTNPYHWRPRHQRAIVLSAAHPQEPLQAFEPRMRGAPMECLSTDVAIRATDALLFADHAAREENLS